MLVTFGFPQTVNDLVDEFLTDDVFVNRGRSVYPALDVAEQSDECVVVAEMPGVKKEDLKLTVEDGILTISGVRKPYEIPENARVLLNEMRVRNFSRTIQLPRGVDAQKITAELQNGVLRVVLPKTEEARVRTIPIQ